MKLRQLLKTQMFREDHGVYRLLFSKHVTNRLNNLLITYKHAYIIKHRFVFYLCPLKIFNRLGTH